MKPTKTTALLAIAVSLPALAWAAGKVDANGDGVWTLDEVQAVFPEMSADGFNAIDVNADGALDEAEVSAAQDAGLIPATEG
ncbi:hypothetical protein M3P21_00065 [Ruegeria sp. 2012CJ41-6]|uniref:EF-hand domain-containing protein n=1 Tax=Ruegeria spongiae TaxID=2942209 RepID=A0ABT0PWE0_9RHOB|nr:hypothetical protein [Ruegeria spongiae]MCL6281913.1 hypothetical protein [Ruegeria spongiae]